MIKNESVEGSTLSFLHIYPQDFLLFGPVRLIGDEV